MLALLLALAVGAAHPKATDAEDWVEKAHVKMKSLDFEAALPLLQKAVASPKLAGRARANALIDLGVTQLNLGNSDDARKSFGQALDADAAVGLPKGVSPKISDLFAEAKKAREAPPPEPKPTPEPPPPELPKDPVVIAPPPVPPPSQGAPAAATTTATATAGSPTRTAGFALLGAGLAVAAAGGVALYLASAEDKKLTSGDYPNGMAMQNGFDRRNAYNTSSIVLAAVGGAVAVAGVVLAVLPGKPEPAAKRPDELTRLNVVAGPGGAMLVASGRW